MLVIGNLLVSALLTMSQETIVLEDHQVSRECTWLETAITLSDQIVVWTHDAFVIPVYNSRQSNEEIRGILIDRLAARAEELLNYTQRVSTWSEQLNESELGQIETQSVILALMRQRNTAIELRDTETRVYFSDETFGDSLGYENRINLMFQILYAAEIAYRESVITLNDGVISLLDCDVVPDCIEIELTNDMMRIYIAYTTLATDVYSDRADLPDDNGDQELLDIANAMLRRVVDGQSQIDRMATEGGTEITRVSENLLHFQALAEATQQMTRVENGMTRREYVYSLLPFAEELRRQHESIVFLDTIPENC